MGNPFVHMELSTGDVDAAKKFYKKVFDWKIEDNKEMQYAMISTGEKNIGGGMQKLQMEGQVPAWLVYAEVDSVKKSMAKAEKAGAKAIVPYMPIGEMGAIGIFADPTGAAFGVWEKGKPAKKDESKTERKLEKAETKLEKLEKKAEQKDAKDAKKAAKKNAKKSGKKSSKKK